MKGCSGEQTTARMDAWFKSERPPYRISDVVGAGPEPEKERCHGTHNHQPPGPAGMEVGFLGKASDEKDLSGCMG